MRTIEPVTASGTTLAPEDLTPEILRHLSVEQLTGLAAEVRRYLVEVVGRTGGHLGPNLGVVELTFALHRVFDSPRTPIIFDVGHQCYVHKIVTGRGRDLVRLRSAGGPSGYPNRRESVHDFVENSHASTGIAYADGLSRAFDLAGDPRVVVVVVGDGALTGGPAWEALNNLATSDRPVVVVINDNNDSYAPTVGGLSRHLRTLAAQGALPQLVDELGGTPVSRSFDRFDTWFGRLGLDYVGPVDGHDLTALETAFRGVVRTRRPVVVHCLTRKGKGYPPAENDPIDHMHTIPPAPKPGARAGRRTWTDVFGDTLLELAGERPDLVAITAAMAAPTGLRTMAVRYPARVLDVGIAEAEAVTLASGLAMGGAHPVVALYATFANRAFDQALCDVALHRLPVTFVLDRAGVTGPDGPSHHGLWDLDLFGLIPGMAVGAPRDAVQLRQLLTEAVERPGPTMIRFPKSAVGGALRSVERWADLDVLRAARAADALLIAVGATAAPTLEAAGLLAADGIECTVVDPRWVLPIAPGLSALAARHRSVFTVEEGVRYGGVGTRLTQTLAEAGLATPIRCLGLPSEFLAHGERSEILRRHGLDAAGIAQTVAEAVGARRRPVLRVVDGDARPLGHRRAPSRPSRRNRLVAALGRGRGPA